MKLNLTVHVHHHSNSVDDKLHQISNQLKKVLSNQAKIMADLTELAAKVEAIENAGDSAIALLQGLKQQLDAAGTDPVALKELSDRLGAQTQELADAVVANTPADPNVDENGEPTTDESEG